MICHKKLSESPDAVFGNLPQMSLCMECHDGKAADKSCVVCHEDPKGKLPADHQRSGWMVEHVGPVLKDNGKSCLMCHTNEQCQVCHQGDYLVP